MRVIKIPITNISRIALIILSISLNIFSHLSWLSDMLNLVFFIAATCFLREIRLSPVFVLIVSSTFAKDGFIKFGFSYTKQLPAPLLGLVINKIKSFTILL